MGSEYRSGAGRGGTASIDPPGRGEAADATAAGMRAVHQGAEVAHLRVAGDLADGQNWGVRHILRSQPLQPVRLGLAFEPGLQLGPQSHVVHYPVAPWGKARVVLQLSRIERREEPAG